MPYSVKGFFEVNEDMVQIPLMLEVLFTQILRLKICSVVLLLALNPACSSTIISSAWGLSLFKMTFSMHDFARMADEADSSVVLAELQVAFLGSVK